MPKGQGVQRYYFKKKNLTMPSNFKKISFQAEISGKGNLNLKLEHPLHSVGGN